MRRGSCGGGIQVIERGNLRAEKVAYPEQTWCCVWRENTFCFDFKVEDLDDLIALLAELRDVEAEIAEDD